MVGARVRVVEGARESTETKVKSSPLPDSWSFFTLSMASAQTVFGAYIAPCRCMIFKLK